MYLSPLDSIIHFLSSLKNLKTLLNLWIIDNGVLILHFRVSGNKEGYEGLTMIKILKSLSNLPALDAWVSTLWINSTR